MAEVAKKTVYNCRLRFDKVSFGCAWHSEAGKVLDYDFACVLFGAKGEIKDAVYYGCMASKGGAVRHMGDDKTGFGAVEEDDECINVHLPKVPEDVAAITFVVGAVPHEAVPMHLNMCDQLTLHVCGAGEEGSEDIIEGGVALKPFLEDSPDGSKPTMLQTATLYRTANGWCVQIVGECTSKGATWGDIIGQMRKALQGVPPMAEDMSITDERIALAKKFEDSPLNALANVRHGERGTSASGPSRDVRKLRCDLGWIVEEGEGKVDMDFNCIFLNAAGEELGTISYKNKEMQGAELAGDDRKGTAEGKDMDRGFPVNESIFINLDEIDETTKSVVFLITNYTESGFGPLRMCVCRFVDVTDEEDMRDLAITSLECGDGETGADQTAVVIAKLYKEFKDSAYWQWRRSGHEDLESYVGQGNLKAALGLGAKVKDIDDYENALATPGDNQGEVFEWRMRSLCTYCAGKVADDVDNDVKSAGLYEGRRDAVGRRHDTRAKMTYPNGDSFFGEYSKDLRQGLGVYVFRQGGVYAGFYRNGKRHGKGLMAYDNGDVYSGAFVNDKPHGEGVYFYKSGAVYAGNYKEGKKHGVGALKYDDGTVLQAHWEVGHLKGDSVYNAPGYESKGKFDESCPQGPHVFTQDLAFGKPRYPSCDAFVFKEKSLKASRGAYSFSTAPAEGEEEPTPAPTEVADANGIKWGGLFFGAGDDVANVGKLKFPPEPFTEMHSLYLFKSLNAEPIVIPTGALD